MVSRLVILVIIVTGRVIYPTVTYADIPHVPNTLHVVFVSTDRGSFPDTDSYVDSIQNAITYWDISLNIETFYMHVPKAYQDLEWVDLYKDVMTLYIVYSGSGSFSSGAYGTASHTLMFAVVMSASPWFEATVAHELGHLVFGLPDLYINGPCIITDIMCNHVRAYRLNFIGCQSLIAIGRYCSYTYLASIRG